MLAMLLLAVAVPGCSGDDDPTQVDETGDDGRRSVGGTDPEDPPHDTVQFYEGTLDLVGPATQTFDVVVPGNVTVVEYRLAWPTAAQFVDLRVELVGCGVYAMGTGSSTIGNAGTSSGRLCTDAGEGPTRLTVSNTGYLQGTITLRGHVPQANATAAPDGSP